MVTELTRPAKADPTTVSMTGSELAKPFVGQLMVPEPEQTPQ